jgi:large subunit ribosomal protein L15
MRGGQNNGWGKHHRGKGNKGGCGNAGRGKRSDHKKRSYEDKPLGKFGFKTHNTKIVHKTISFREIEDQLQTWTAKKLVEMKGDLVHVDLGKLGYTKLLANGRLTKKLQISVPHASQRAIEKIKAAGGEAQ